MNEIVEQKLEALIKKNVRLFNLKLKRKKDNPFILSEEYHLTTRIENELFSWELQFTIGITENDKIHMMMFLDPIIIDNYNRGDFINFANSENLWLGSSLGRFWVNDENDYCYEVCLPSFFVNYPAELELELFDKPFSHFRDCLTPLLQLKDSKWSVEKAIQYLNELRTRGFVDNIEYGL